jgi:hypothetical protein
MLYKGSCHCGKVAFEVDSELSGAISCNCSICSRKGALLWAVPRDALRLRTAEGSLGTYRFNKNVIEHRFCRTCSVHPFAEDAAPTGERSAYINIRCLEGLDLASVPIQEFDGRSM